MKRAKNPLRQSVPSRTCTVTYARYGRYKKSLQADFKARCGYCADSDSIVGYRNYAIDHFVPKDQLNIIQEYDYSNLVYSCFFCNNSKSSDWPSGDETIAVIDDRGYIDPCSPEYDKQYYRDRFGNIIPQTDLGKYMHEKLNLSLKRHSVLWMLEILSSQISVLKSLKSKKSLSKDNKKRFMALLERHHEYMEYLKDENNK